MDELGRSVERLIQLNRLLSGLAIDAVNVQILLDRGFVESFDALAVGHDSLEEIPEQLVAALAPRRQFAAHFEMELGIALGQTTEVGLTIGAVVVNACYELRYGSAVRQHSRVRLEIEQVPAPAAPA